MMSYYKFAAKIIGQHKKVLDLGCGEGLGTWLLAVECGLAKGMDNDRDAIKIGKRNWQDDRISFECADLFARTQNDRYDAVVAFDVIEHIFPKKISTFWEQIRNYLQEDGIVIIGTPNITSNQYASSITKAGHINLYSRERLEAELREYFKRVFIFGANDEVVHTGFGPMAHYLIAIGIGIKTISDKRIK
jgi:2-polyprenyl-3-methyl-5-hydroxy-6-metoxy-1,4-benzoquinol methylase